ncbi:NADPH-dependent 2,4-dienoyl-CoA reductase/sulfur reductase-like enzyme [Streptohalobacillus salinus]|uniref:NADPH-dependent 2,4-dienoyl-CoA reductase/sulfur reductase-like enzyme n=1 Tax=Streptohalobacillus salinus TaxID=621096 RepID=A0A2V3WDH9_9BACI|nr:FAD-dependent oxidoreductase [Streptohalobacillus salinus]PXW92966.1 NADPH-dependent 2,4-dienoyl-CoA reductase/sulfur reductase-like enzyme [Streptohalobacillus salinus]
MGKRVLIVGGVAGGASVAARVRRLDENAEIVMFERGPHVSFSNCALPYYLSGEIEESETLVLMNPDVFRNQYNIEARTRSEVIAVHAEQKTITVKNLDTGDTYEEAYDKLVLSPGASPIVPPLEGVTSEHVFTVRNVVDIERLQGFVSKQAIEDVVVIGGGFIGIEVAENLVHAGKKVTLVEAQNQVMAPFDYDMVQILHKEMIDNGMDLILGDGIQSVKADHIVLASGKTVKAQAVIMAIGVRPETSLAKEAGLEIGKTGGIKVDHSYRTSAPDIYAVGDAIEVHHKITGQKTRLALAGPAQRQARAAADDMYGIPHRNNGVIGSSAIQVFNMNAASTGLNERTCEQVGYDYDVAFVIPSDKVGIMPNSNPMYFKLIFEKPTGRVLGAQAIGRGNVDKRIDVIASMIMMHATLEDLKELELCYSPVFGTAKDVVNFAALAGLNILNGVIKQVRFNDVRELVEQGATIIDGREPGEFKHGHIKTAINIPLSEFRQRLDEIPTDKPIYVHCRSGQRSYNMVKALTNLGYDNVYNIAGSYLGTCLYEYFNDQQQGREPIVTNYNFR